MDAYWQEYELYAIKNIIRMLEEKEKDSLNDFLKNMYDSNPKAYILIPAVFPMIDVATRTGKESFKECLAQLDRFMSYCGKQGTYLEKVAEPLNRYLKEAGKKQGTLDEKVKNAVNKHNKQVNDFKEWALEYFGKCYEKWPFDKNEAKDVFYRAKNAYEKEQKNKKSSAETEKVIKELCEKFGISA